MRCSLRDASPSLSSGAHSRDPLAMLLRMRSAFLTGPSADGPVFQSADLQCLTTAFSGGLLSISTMLAVPYRHGRRVAPCLRIARFDQPPVITGIDPDGWRTRKCGYRCPANKHDSGQSGYQGGRFVHGSLSSVCVPKFRSELIGNCARQEGRFCGNSIRPVEPYRQNADPRSSTIHRRDAASPVRSAASRLPLAKNRQVTQLVGQRLVIRAISHQGRLHAHRIDNNRYNRQPS